MSNTFKSRFIQLNFAVAFVVLVLGLTSLGCSPSIALYDQYAYAQATIVKVDALSTMDMATESSERHAGDIQLLMTKLEKAYEYEHGRPKNEISAQMWTLLKDPDKNLLGGFIKRWQDEKVLGKAFVDEAKILVGKAFDCIIGLESEKLKSSDAQSMFEKLVH